MAQNLSLDPIKRGDITKMVTQVTPNFALPHKRNKTQSKFNWDRICLQFHSYGCWQDSVSRRLDRGPHSLPAISWRLSSVLYLMVLFSMAAWFIETNKKEFASKITDVTSCQFCCILLIRSKSPDRAHTQGERLAQGCECREARVMGCFLGRWPTTLS